MANLPEIDEWSEGIYQLELTDPVLGGPPNEATKAGVDNVPHLQLAKRTFWLKTRVDQLMQSVVAASTTVAGLVRLSNATNSASTTMAATPAAVKAAMDNADARVPASRQILTDGLASGGGPLTGNVTVAVQDASQAEAEAGTQADRAMSPLRVAQAIASRLVAVGIPSGRHVDNLNDLADSSGFGAAGSAPANGPAFDYPGVMTVRRGTARTAQIALPTNSNAPRLAARSQDSTGTFGPWAEAWMGAPAAEQLLPNGYQRKPSGFIEQWMQASYLASDGAAGTLITLPIAFPNACFRAFAVDVGSGCRPCGIIPVSKSQLRLWVRDLSGSYINTGVNVFALGY